MSIGRLELGCVLGLLLLIDLEVRLQQQRGLCELTVLVGCELSADPQEWLLKVVVALGRDVIVLKVLLAVKLNVLGAHLTILAVDLVSAEADGDAFAHAGLAGQPQ